MCKYIQKEQSIAFIKNILKIQNSANAPCVSNILFLMTYSEESYSAHGNCWKQI